MRDVFLGTAKYTDMANALNCQRPCMKQNSFKRNLFQC